jgi:hypothetical protein
MFASSNIFTSLYLDLAITNFEYKRFIFINTGLFDNFCILCPLSSWNCVFPDSGIPKTQESFL